MGFVFQFCLDQLGSRRKIWVIKVWERLLVVWTAASVYTQIIINVVLGCMNPKPNISELILEAMTHSSSLCHGYVAGLDVLLKQARYFRKTWMFFYNPKLDIQCSSSNCFITVAKTQTGNFWVCSISNLNNVKLFFLGNCTVWLIK